jgi:LysM repeat protein
MKNILKLTGWTLCLLIAQISFASVQDSIGVEKKENKTYVLHKVDPGESLYGLAKTYDVTVDEIKAANPGIANGLKVGQVVKVPYKAKATTTSSNSTSTSTEVVMKKHKIQSGESLYSIADKYNTTIADIKKANPGMSSSIQAGQVINVPVKQTVAATTTPKPIVTQPSTSNQTSPTASTETFTHKVTAGESLYSIARKYNVSVDEIKKVNPNMPSSIKVGQLIKIPGTAPTETTTPTTTTPTNTATTKPTTTVVAPTTTTTTKPTTTTTPTTPVKVDSAKLERDRNNLQTTVGKPTTTQPTTTKPAQNGDFKKITESGNALLMADHQDDSKFLAYHKTAPVGTIIQVINDQNGQKIYVRVIGKLNDSDSKNVISLSKKAFERVGGTGTMLKVDLMYIP